MTFGSAAGLGVSSFTLEVWFRKEGAGVATSSGTGGITNIISIISKGRAEADGSNLDMNYILGLSGGKLCADFEERAGQAVPGLNHPIYGTTIVQDSVWYHGAVSYEGYAGKSISIANWKRPTV